MLLLDEVVLKCSADSIHHFLVGEIVCYGGSNFILILMWLKTDFHKTNFAYCGIHQGTISGRIVILGSSL